MDSFLWLLIGVVGVLLLAGVAIYVLGSKQAAGFERQIDALARKSGWNWKTIPGQENWSYRLSGATRTNLRWTLSGDTGSIREVEQASRHWGCDLRDCFPDLRILVGPPGRHRVGHAFEPSRVGKIAASVLLPPDMRLLIMWPATKQPFEPSKGVSLEVVDSAISFQSYHGGDNEAVCSHIVAIGCAVADNIVQAVKHPAAPGARPSVPDGA